MPIKAAEVMTSPVITVPPTATIADIATLLAAKHISAVPVADAAGNLLGVVSEGDIIRPFRESTRAKRDWWLSVVAEGEELSQEFLAYMRRDTRTAADVMVPHVISAAEDATLPELAELMVKHGVKRIPILKGMKIVGIVSRADVVSALAKQPDMMM